MRSGISELTIIDFGVRVKNDRKIAEWVIGLSRNQRSYNPEMGGRNAPKYAEAICIYRDDDKIDEQYELLIRNLIEHMMNEPRSIPQVVEIIKCAHAIERVGDRCQNISDYIIYYLEGKDMRHGTQIIDQ